MKRQKDYFVGNLTGVVHYPKHNQSFIANSFQALDMSPENNSSVE